MSIVCLRECEALRFFKNYLFRTEITTWDIAATFAHMGIKEEDYIHASSGYNEEEGSFIKYRSKADNTLLVINTADLLEKTTIEDCILETSVGYQRRGANGAFYETDLWDTGGPVLDLDTLLQHWHLYFSESEAEKQHFKANIVDKFIQNETYVSYC